MSTVISDSRGEVRKVLDIWAEAVQTKDVDRVMSLYTRDNRLFDIIPPIEHRGHDAYRKLWDMCFPSFRGPMNCEFRDLKIAADENAAFSHGFYHFSGTMNDGKDMEVWIRVTFCLQKTEGNWLITHDHHSVPIDMESHKALFDIKP